MSYRYYVTKRSPVSVWMLDDDAPFQEYSGLGSVADMLSGVPTKSVPLVAGAGYSSAFKRGVSGRFPCNLFQRGQENRTFALESWVLPIRKTSGITVSKKNLVHNPSYEYDLYGTSPGYGAATREAHPGGGYFARLTTNDLAGTPYIFGATNPAYVSVDPAKRYSFRADLRLNFTDKTAAHVYAQIRFIDALGGSVTPNITTTTAQTTSTEWTTVEALNFVVPAGANRANIIFYSSNADDAIGDTIDIDKLMFVEGATVGEYFDGDTPGARWLGTPGRSESEMMVSVGDQQILSHSGEKDGLTINGSVVRFGTSYETTGDAFCDYDLGELKLAHVVGKHNADQNELWVNGELVATVELTDEQKADTYISTTPYLYSGDTTSSQEVAMNGVAFYPNLSGDDIKRNYEAGIDFIGQDRVYPQFGGTPFDLAAANGAVFIEEVWADKPDFERGMKNNVEYAPDQIEPYYTNDLSLAGDWTASIPLDGQNDTSIYGVMVAWSGYNVTVEVSLDGITWTSAASGRLVSIIPNGYNPSGKDLQIRAKFAAGIARGNAWLESLRVIGFRNNTIENISPRPVTASHPAVVRGDYEPNLYRDDNGVYLNGGTLTIGTDTSVEPEVMRTLELWVKPVSGAVTISLAGTKYRNGVADTSLPVGEWSLVHIVAASDITSAVTVSGNAIVGQATMYPDPLTAADIDFIWDSYVGRTATRVVDSSTTGVSETASPANIYAHDWAIDSAG